VLVFSAYGDLVSRIPITKPEVFIPAGLQLARSEMIHGIHESFIALGAFTLASTIIFSKLESADGDSIIRRRI
jgi:hypothetical protein